MKYETNYVIQKRLSNSYKEIFDEKTFCCKLCPEKFFSIEEYRDHDCKNMNKLIKILKKCLGKQ